MCPLQWNWPCIFMTTEVVGWIIDYHVNVHILHGGTFYIHSIVGQ